MIANRPGVKVSVAYAPCPNARDRLLDLLLELLDKQRRGGGA